MPAVGGALSLTAASPVIHFGAAIELRGDDEALRQAVLAAVDLAPRRALVFSHDGKPSYRDMRTLGSVDLDDLSDQFERIYEEARRYLSDRLGSDVHGAPDRNERYVLNVLDRPFDEQGWHTDTYAYAVNLCLEAPCEGGLLELALPDGNLSLEPEQGSWYALRTDAVAHRVTPLRCGRRIVLNLAYHDSALGEAVSYSSASLYQPREESR